MTIIEEATMKSIQGIYKKLPDLNGATLRDLFAIQAMQGFLTCGKEWDMQEIAELSYRQADAMLEARKK